MLPAPTWGPPPSCKQALILPRERIQDKNVVYYEQAIVPLDRFMRLKLFFPFPPSLHTLSASPVFVFLVYHHF